MVLNALDTMLDRVYDTTSGILSTIVCNIFGFIGRLLYAIYKVVMIFMTTATIVLIWATPIFLLTVLICVMHEKRADRKLLEASRMQQERHKKQQMATHNVNRST